MTDLTGKNGGLFTEDNGAELAQWCRGKLVEEIDPVDPELKSPAINVQTKDGVKRAHVGDYIGYDIDYDVYRVYSPER